MEDIKRYDIGVSSDGHELEQQLETDPFFFDTSWCKSLDVDKLISDHKAVVETLEKDISVSGTAVNDLIDLVDELKQDKLTMQNKIEELEKDNKEFCDLLVNRYDYSDREADEITERAENYLAKGIK